MLHEEMTDPNRVDCTEPQTQSEGVAGNPKAPRWRHTPNEARVNKKLNVTPTPDARAEIERIARVHGLSLSAVISRVFEWLGANPRDVDRILRRPK